MIMMVIPKEITKNREELERILKAEVYSFAYERGLSMYFLEDSKAVQEGIDNIASRVADLLYEVKLDQHIIKMHKEHKEAEEKEKCKHCGYPINIRNPSGYCDHLRYPEYCEECKKEVKHVKTNRQSKKSNGNTTKPKAGKKN